ncbi:MULTISPECIES: NUDIX hydrolase [unclassified Nocardiopsis]|uniref:NUDIX domain-containing protein n=1 Tax=unclassified Nocardiopsis TaxID=2649073 RepID=UPI00135C2393|nr:MULTISPECIES: NUDIX hydrolase [unclassified Nocardiopsis]
MGRTDTGDEQQFRVRPPGVRGAAGALIRSPAGEVLLVERVYRPDQPWGLPGGIIEQDESPLAACRRELAEELGVQAVIEHLAAVDWVPPRAGGTAALQWLFVVRLPENAELRLPPDELSGWAWVAPDRLGELLSAHVARRVRAALAARERGATAYLEHGHPMVEGEC